MNTRYLFLFFALLGMEVGLAQTSELSVEKIMQDPSWIGTFPSDIEWDAASENIYFDYNPQGNPADSLYRISVADRKNIVKVSPANQREVVSARGKFNEKGNKKIYVEDGSIIIYDLNRKSKKKVLELGGNLNDPQFLNEDELISFTYDNNAFVFDLEKGVLSKITDIRKGEAPATSSAKLSDKDKWLQDENLKLLEVVRNRKQDKEASKAYREATKPEEEFVFYTGDKFVSNIEISPNAKFVSLNLIARGNGQNTIVPDYVDASGYTTDLRARSKVGTEETTVDLAIYNIEQDTVYLISKENLPGIADLPDYVTDYPDREWKEEPREVIFSRAYFSEDGEKAIVNIRSKDNKDRWIAEIDLASGKLKTLDRQRDEAWINGPGIGYTYGGGTLGWLPDNRHIYFQSEESGYSHLYLLDVETGKKKQLTSGNFEVFDPFLSKNKKHWYLTSSEVHPGERHFYKMPVMGGKMEQLTNMAGNNDVYLSPDEKYMAILHSYDNKPWELYLKRTTSRKNAEQLTYGQTEEFTSYPWRDPENITFKAADGATVHARLFVPEKAAKNEAAVIFVHGAGYLQNSHKWWSSYFREYMFHNLLTDLGYTVIDIDYRGSAGYGRDWRTGIYRHMGGKDLSDQVDGANYLVSEHGIDPEKIGIYGGSYGGFITLMALFTEADTFAAGAALRSVTDWAHYNHGYTSNILNEPALDPIAYRRSSPIYFAEGLEGDLLIAHGMVDINVHFQDVVRLAQRLIELRKENWEMAVYPVEDHGFVEPTSWMDEYKRILKLFNESLLEK